MADLLLHVTDVSHPDFHQHIGKVNQVLSELESSNKPTMMVYNKIDRLPAHSDLQERTTLSCVPFPESNGNGYFVSAEKEIGISELIERIMSFALADWVEVWLFLENGNSDLLPRIYRYGVVTESRFEKGGISLKIRGKRENIKKLRRLDDGIKIKLISDLEAR
jgi:50S ribosomal subunit-associated GTPase HflX